MRRRLNKKSNPPADPVAAAATAALRYVSDQRLGIRRLRAGKGFTYRDAKNRPVRNSETLQRIRQLVIPPAWTDVWICPLTTGHIQATGRDAKGRKQYLYHERWRSVRDEAKFHRMIQFGAVLPKLRRRIHRDLAQRGISREKVLAGIIRLLESTSIRVGNEEYARTNGSFGLTTLRNHHVQVTGQTIHFHFRGKSGKVHTIDFAHPRIARLVKQCQDLPGHELFAFLDDDGQIHEINSEDVNNYLREITGQEFTAKDFRTWNGTLLTIEFFLERNSASATRPAAMKKTVNDAIRHVAEELGNTMAVCRKCYIHPAVIEAFQNNALTRLKKSRKQKQNGASIDRGLRSSERILLQLLSQPEPSARRTAA